VLVWAINKGLTLAGMPHLAPSIVWAISSVCLGLAAYLTTDAASPGNKLAQKVLAILAIVGAVGVQQFDPKTPDEEAPEASEPAPSVAPDTVGGTVEAVNDSGTLYVAPDASAPEVLPLVDPPEVVEPPAVPDVLQIPLAPATPDVLILGCLVPVFGSFFSRFRRTVRRALLVAVLAFSVSGCCGTWCPSVKADEAQGARGACWIVKSLTSQDRPCTLPGGEKLTADECALRLDLERLYLERHKVDCDDVAL